MGEELELEKAEPRTEPTATRTRRVKAKPGITIPWRELAIFLMGLVVGVLI